MTIRILHYNYRARGDYRVSWHDFSKRHLFVMFSSILFTFSHSPLKIILKQSFNSGSVNIAEYLLCLRRIILINKTICSPIIDCNKNNSNNNNKGQKTTREFDLFRYFGQSSCPSRDLMKKRIVVTIYKEYAPSWLPPSWIVKPKYPGDEVVFLWSRLCRFGLAVLFCFLFFFVVFFQTSTT